MAFVYAKQLKFKSQIPPPPNHHEIRWGVGGAPTTRNPDSRISSIKISKANNGAGGRGEGGGGSGRAYSSSNMSRFWTSSIPASSTAAAAPAMPRGGEGAAASARGKGRVCARRELRRSVSAASGGGGGGVINNGWAGRAGPRGRRGGGGPTCQRALYICTSRSLSGSATCVPLPYVVFFFFGSPPLTVAERWGQECDLGHLAELVFLAPLILFSGIITFFK